MSDNTVQEFLRQLRENPTDESLRLVAADALQEAGVIDEESADNLRNVAHQFYFDGDGGIRLAGVDLEEFLKPIFLPQHNSLDGLREVLAYDAPAVTREYFRRYNPDVADLWEQLEHDERDSLVRSNVIQAVTPQASIVAQEHWGDGVSDNGGYWPGYTVEIGHPSWPNTTIPVEGWSFVGPHWHTSEWGTENNDGNYRGRPTAMNWQIHPGDHLGGPVDVPLWQSEDGQWYTFDVAGLDEVLDRLSYDVDHGSEPYWADIAKEGMDAKGYVYASIGGEMQEVPILHGGMAPYDEEIDDHPYRQTRFHAEAWSHGLADEVFETEEEAREHLLGLTDDGELYDDFQDDEDEDEV